MSARTLARDLAPAWLRDRVRTYLLIRRARRLQRTAQSQTRVEDIVETAFAFGCFYPNQVRSEVTALLDTLAARRPRRLLEIGSQGGGNLFLLSKVAAPDAQMMSIDLNYSPIQMAAYPSLVAPTQRLTCLQGDSSAPDTVQRVKDWLGGERLDFLFIDGDHTYAGVAADYRNYAPLMASGGLIGFHDIVPDHTTRYGRKTIAMAGEVPVFWNELKARQFGCREIVENPEQDGAGIGLVECSG